MPAARNRCIGEHRKNIARLNHIDRIHFGSSNFGCVGPTRITARQPDTAMLAQTTRKMHLTARLPTPGLRWSASPFRMPDGVFARTTDHLEGLASAPYEPYRALLAVSEAIASRRDLPALFHELAGRLDHVVRFDSLALVLH